MKEITIKRKSNQTIQLTHERNSEKKYKQKKRGKKSDEGDAQQRA